MQPLLRLSYVRRALYIAASMAIVTELRGEIAALKAEVSELRSALNTANQKLENELRAQAEALAPSQTTSMSNSANKITPLQPRLQQHRPNRLATSQRKLRVPVEGKRRIWGTRKTTSAADVIHTINSQTSIKTGLDVKCKYRSRPGNPHAVSKWWFIVSGEENLLMQLKENKWQ